MQFGLGDFVSMIERYFEPGVARVCAATVAVLVMAILAALAFEIAFAPAGSSIASVVSTTVGAAVGSRHFWPTVAAMMFGLGLMLLFLSLTDPRRHERREVPEESEVEGSPTAG